MRERGQGLAEYALVLVLVAVIVVLVAAVFGQDVKKLYCGAVYSIAPETDAPGCVGIEVSCVVLSKSTGQLSMEAIVTDNKGDDDIQTVKWSIDGAPPIQTEEHYRYCLGGGDPTCYVRSISSGEHTITAIATDAENNTGKCTMVVTVP